MEKIILFLLFLPTALFAAELNGTQIAQRVFDREDGQDAIVQLRVTTSHRLGATQVRTTINVRKEFGGLSKSYMRFISPADVAGAVFLSWENKGQPDDQFIYLPELGRDRRIVSNQKGDSFTGTAYTFEDMERRQVELDTHTLLRSETEQGRDCWVVESVPKLASGSNYKKRVLWIAKEADMPVRIDYYSRKTGQLIKRYSVSKLQKVQGVWTAMTSDMHILASDEHTVNEVLSAKYNAGVTNNQFTRAYMKRIR